MRTLYSQRLVFLTAVLTTLVSLNAQAALPESIQVALNKAALTPNDISILITPVGNKNASRLPPIVLVTDSESKNTIDSTVKSANVISSQNKAAIALVTLDKQAIEQQERALNAYTDDPYTHQSLESTPSLLANDKGTFKNVDPDQTATANLNTSANANTVLFSHNPTIARTPASTMKLIPSFIALDTLGADFVWFTRVYHSGIIIGNRLHGDLIIQGSGDPKMTHKRLEQLLYRIQKSGIHHIVGDIIIDSAVFKNVSKDPAAFDNSPLRPYNASPDGLLINFNIMSINSHSLNNGQAQLTYIPQLANYQLPNVVNTRASACSNARYSLAPQWHTDKLTLSDKLPDSCGEHIFYVTYPDAKDFAARVIDAKWQALGNTLSGKVISQETPYVADNSNNFYNISKPDNNKRPAVGLSSLPVSLLPIVSYPSFNLTQQIYDINHFSNNVMTEQVALSIGAYSKTATANTVQTKLSSSLNKKVEVNKPAANSTASLYQFDKPKTSDYPQALETINQCGLICRHHRHI